MPAIYKRVDEPKKKNCYEIKFAFEHGDGDSSTTELVTLKNISEDDFIKYVKKAQDIAEDIYQNRSFGNDLPANFLQNAKMENYNIPIELDNYAKLSVSDYYADMVIEEMHYYDENGIKFKVTVT